MSTYRITILGIVVWRIEVSIVYYAGEGTSWGKRKLGRGRYAFDVGCIAFLWEYYR